MNNEIFENWMKQPGLVKKLQGFLALSVILNMFLFMQILPNTAKEKTVKAEPQAQIQEEKVTRQSKITELELKEFIDQYLDNFFSSSETALEFIQSFSSANLFEKSLKTELETRISQKINSKFMLDDLFLESVSSNQAKAIILGRETFPEHDYENRSFTIQLIINTEKLQVESIPVFKID